MNPDFKFDTIWTISNGDDSVSFKMTGDKKIVLIYHRGTKNSYSLKTARSIWKDFIRRGYVLTNKSNMHDMDNFHDAYRKMEITMSAFKKPKAYEAYQNIHDMELKEARIDPKKFYSNYALDA